MPNNRPYVLLIIHRPRALFLYLSLKKKKTQANALLGPSPVCKAVGECQAPLDVKLSLALSLAVELSTTLSVNNGNMQNSTLAGEIAGANNVTQNPTNPSYGSNTVAFDAAECAGFAVTDFKTGHVGTSTSDTCGFFFFHFLFSHPFLSGVFRSHNLKKTKTGKKRIDTPSGSRPTWIAARASPRSSLARRAARSARAVYRNATPAR